MTSPPLESPLDEGFDRQIHALLQALEEHLHDAAPAHVLLQRLRQTLAQREAFAQSCSQALRQDEQRFRSVFQYNLDAVFWVNSQGRFEAINPAAERLTGYSLAEIRQMALPDLVFPECLPETQRIFTLALAGDARPVETAIRRKDGQRVDLWVAGGPIMVDGALQGVFGVARDITQRRHAEQELRASRDRLELALEAGHAGMIQWDLRTNKLWWNAYAFHIHGYPPDSLEPTFEFWLTRVHPEDLAHLMDNLRGCQDRHIPDIAVEYRILRPTGEVRWVRGVGRFAFDPAGAAESFTGIVLDITDQRLAEARFSFLAEASRLLASSLDPAQILARLTRLSVPFLADFCVIYQIDSPSSFHLVARTHLRPEWEPALDRIGQRFRTIPTHPDSKIRAAIQTGQAQLLVQATEEDCRHATQDPELLAFWVMLKCHSAIIVPLAAHGKTLGVLFLFMTESPRQYGPDDLRAAQALGERAAVALYHAQLYADAQAARAEAETANAAKDRFLAVLSHELRTPLTPVMAAVQMMERDPTLAPAQRQWAAMLQRNVALEARLIDDLLDVTRISRGKIQLHPVPVDLHSLLWHVVTACQTENPDKPVRFDVALPAPHHYVRGDAARLQQVFWNLLKNALKFTPDNGTIAIRTENEPAAMGPQGPQEGSPSPPTPPLIITVQDTGMGIDPDLLPRIFNAFEQGGAGTTHRFGGLGLGLAITRGLVELHGGTITAYSGGPGQGATFRILLPTIPAPAEGAGDRAKGSARNLAPPSPTPSLRILLVEDHPDTASTLAKLLQTYGHSVRVAHSVAAALELAAAEPLDLLISDIGLPDGTGLDLMRHLVRQRPIRGIALSGYGMEDDLRRSQEAGFQAHLVKPVNLDLLHQTIQRLLTPAP